MTANQSQNQQGNEGQPQDFSGLVENGKLLGKYDSPEALKEGYWNSVQEMNKAKEQLGRAVEIIQALQTQGQPLQPQAPAQPVYETRLNELGIPVDALNQLIDARAQRIADARVATQLTPLVRGSNARSEMAQQYADYAENENTIFKAAKSNPQLAQRFDELIDGGFHHQALELAYFHWLRTKQPTPSPEVDAARNAARMPTGQTGVGRTGNMTTAPSEKALEDAFRHYQETQDIVPLMNLRYGNVPLTYTEQMEALARGMNR